LTSVTIGKGVKSIGERAFAGCKELKSVTIPNTVVSIGGGAFSGCSDQIEIKFEDNDIYQVYNYMLIDNRNNSVVQYIKSTIDSVFVIPDYVESIEPFAFFSLGNLTTVIIPSSVTHVGYSAFGNCSNLTTVYYLGTTAVEGNQTSKLKVMCVRADYPSTSFAEYNVTPDEGQCIEFRNLFGPCSTAVFVDDHFQKEKAPSEWEYKGNLCAEYTCLEDGDNVWWSICNTTNDSVCINDTCITGKSRYDNMWRIELELDDMYTKDFDKDEIVDYVEGIGVEQEVSIGVRIDDKGEVLSIQFYIQEEKTKDKVVQALRDTFDKCNVDVSSGF